jgi:hypothetical protein
MEHGDKVLWLTCYFLGGGTAADIWALLGSLWHGLWLECTKKVCNLPVSHHRRL